MLQTAKYAFAQSLKKMLSEKPLDKITVKDLVRDCGTSRQAFYYHFEDIYDLIEWVYMTEMKESLAGNCHIDTWQKGFLSLLQHLDDNKDFVMNTYRSISRDSLESYMYKFLFSVIYPVVEEQAAGLIVEQRHKEFIAHFYSTATTGMSLDWIKNGMKHPPEELVGEISTLVKGNFHRALLKYALQKN